MRRASGHRVERRLAQRALYIHTPPEFEQIMRDRSEALLASPPAGPAAFVERLEMAHRTAKSVYTTLKKTIPGE